MANEQNTRGGSSEQHAEAGRQSHKNDDKGGSGKSGGESGSNRGGTREQHAEAGRQSHKNDDRGGSSGRGGSGQ